MIDHLIGRIRSTGNPTVAGLDPRLDLIPDFIKADSYAKYGKTLEGAADSFYQFNVRLIDALCDIVPAVKPQIAMYEALGVAGLIAYEKTVAYAKKNGLVVIGDIKRGDIASTAEAYANAHIGVTSVEKTPFKCFDADMVTLNPYMGEDSITPFLNVMHKYDKGLFILVKTSNPGSGQIQDLPVGTDGRPLYETVGRLVEQWGEPYRGRYGYSDVGAVVGATYPEQGRRLRELLPHTFFLVPGYGAQGATAADIAGCFDSEGRGAIVNSSRGIIGAWKKPQYAGFGEEGFAEAARQAAINMKNDLLSVL